MVGIEGEAATTMRFVWPPGLDRGSPLVSGQPSAVGAMPLTPALGAMEGFLCGLVKFRRMGPEEDGW